MSVVTDADIREAERDTSPAWWLFLLTGIAWIVISFLVLGFDPTSAATIGYMLGFVLIAAGINEFMVTAMLEGWRWLHALLGILFLVAGIAALLSPFQTFGILALLIGWYLLFKGIFDVIFSIAARHELDLWGLLLAAGIAQIAIGLWALGYPGRSSWLLVLWVGIGAVMRGITEIVTAFQLRSVQHSVERGK
ncbi:MAG TPA: DUF308 domain-containing protein [Microthrixaceae bacterium]|nr:DUF308 domain-containing protein [Microthrixaceae bacterium]